MGQGSKVLVTDGIAAVAVERLQNACDVTVNNDISADELLQVIGGYDALIVRSRTKVTRAVFEAGTNLKVVGRAGVGVDNIDLAAATEHNVIVVNSPLAATIAVAELTLGLMLSLARSIPQADASMKDGQWAKKQFKGTELYGKTLGLVGMGRIGAAVAGRCASMGMRVVAYDPYLPDDPDQVVKTETLYEVLAEADFVSIHTPLTEETAGMIDSEALSHMKPTGYLLCTARGGVVDEAALLDALNSGTIAGAALDVFAVEPPTDLALVSHPKLIALPHVGAQTREAQTRAGEDIAQEVIAALNNQPLRTRVN